MPTGFPTAPAVQTITDKLATIAPELGNVPGYYVYLKDPIAGTIYESATATDGAGNWSITGVTMGLTYQYSYGRHPATAYPFQGAYVASNPATLPLAATTQAGTGAAPTPTTLWRFNAPSGDSHGPFQAVVGGAFFVDTFDRVLYWGYNGSDGGGNVVAAEPKFTFQIESDYNDGANHQVESYFEYAKASGASGATTYRPIFMQVNRATGALHFEINSTAGFSFSTTDGNATQWGSLAPTGLTITPLTGQAATLTLGAASGASGLVMKYAGSNALTISPQSANDVQFQLAAGVNVLELFTSRGISINVQDNTAAFTVQGAAAGGNVAKIISGSTAGDLMRFQESGGTTHIKVTQATSAIPASLVVGKAVLANAATDGFLYLPTMAGTPTAAPPTAQTGTSPFVYDTTAHKLWAYDGSWKGVVLA